MMKKKSAATDKGGADYSAVAKGKTTKANWSIDSWRKNGKGRGGKGCSKMGDDS